MAWHAIAHAPAVQTLTALSTDGIGHVEHEVPQCSTSLSGKQPVKAGHICDPVPQVVPQTPAALQVAFAPPGQGVQAPSWVPHVATAEFETHWPLHRWYPSSHSNPQVPFTQVRTAFARVGQGVQLVPHESTLLFDEHVVGFAVGQA